MFLGICLDQEFSKLQHLIFVGINDEFKYFTFSLSTDIGHFLGQKNDQLSEIPPKYTVMFLVLS